MAVAAGRLVRSALSMGSLRQGPAATLSVRCFRATAAKRSSEDPPVEDLSVAVARYWENVKVLFAEPTSANADSILNRDSSVHNERTVTELVNGALRVGRGPSSDIMPNLMVGKLCEFYSSLDLAGRRKFFLLLSTDFGINEQELAEAMGKLQAAKSRGERAVLWAGERVQFAACPAYQQLFKEIAQQTGGMQFVLGMREDLLKVLRTEKDAAAHLKAVDGVLKRMLVDWFSVGFLDLKRLTWNSPASYLEQIKASEAVHPMRDWDDLKRRLGSDRRVFGFFHRSLPYTPLTVVHVALVKGAADNVMDLIKPPAAAFDRHSVDTAVFYTISSTQPGLSGADLGNFLIKRVAKELKAELPNLTTFVTLSPIPGFRKWLDGKIHQHETGSLADDVIVTSSEAPALLAHPKAGGAADPVLALKALLAQPNWLQSEDVASALKKPLSRLCARYLVNERKRRFALDPVTNFHVRNGASVYRVNWAGDTSSRGMARAYGLMVNYRYILEDVEKNNERYLLDAVIPTGPLVKNLLEGN